MNANQLKKIAEAIGWTDMYVSEGMTKLLLGIPQDCSMEEEFNPKENLSQLYEIGEWLLEEEYLIKSGKFRNGTYSIRVSRAPHESFAGEGKTRVEAILNAMLQVIENE